MRTSLVPLTRRGDTVRLCSWMSCSRVMRNFLSSPSCTEKRCQDRKWCHDTSRIRHECVLRFQSVPAEVQWSSSDHQPPDCGSKSRSCRRQTFIHSFIHSVLLFRRERCRMQWDSQEDTSRQEEEERILHQVRVSPGQPWQTRVRLSQTFHPNSSCLDRRV